MKNEDSKEIIKKLFSKEVKEHQNIFISFLYARAVTEAFKTFIFPEETKLKSLAYKINKIRPKNVKKVNVKLFEGDGLDMMIRYTFLINPYFSAIKTTINQLQKYVQKKYNFKVSKKKGYTMHFFKRLEQEKPNSKELQIFNKYRPLIEEVKDTRDRTEHFNPKTIVKYKSKDNSITIPIFKCDIAAQKYIEKERVNFLNYMEETNRQIHKLIMEIKDIR